uniref:Uncharacterized protein n=1 Tax=Triticum urartu TaxID=4572 RepID=A0A8R7PC89_TRIUA
RQSAPPAPHARLDLQNNQKGQTLAAKPSRPEPRVPFASSPPRSILSHAAAPSPRLPQPPPLLPVPPPPSFLPVPPATSILPVLEQRCLSRGRTPGLYLPLSSTGQ